MTYLWSIVGVVASLTITVVIAGMNFVHGGSLIADDAKLLMSCGMLALDALKASTPFFVFSAWTGSRRVIAIFGAVMWCTLTGISFFNVTGFFNVNRSVVASAREMAGDRHSDRRSAIAIARARVEALGFIRPSAAIEGEIRLALMVPVEVGSKKTTVGQATRNCEDVSRLATEHCGPTLQLRAELASSRASEQARADLDQLFSSDTTVRVDADPQTHFLQRLLGGERSRIETWTIILLAAGFELASSLGLFLSLNHDAIGKVRRGETRRGPLEQENTNLGNPRTMAATVEGELAEGDVAQFACDCLVPASGNSIEISDLHPAYSAWCSLRACRAHEREVFTRKFLQLCTHAGFPITTIKGGWIVHGLTRAGNRHQLGIGRGHRHE